MSDFEMLLTAWLNGGEIPADFKPTSRVEEYLLAILNGVDDNVDPKSRADVLLDAIATKYAGYADGIEYIRNELGFTGKSQYDLVRDPITIAASLYLINQHSVADLADKGVAGVDANILAILDAYENLPSGGAGFEATIEGAPTISAIISGFTATVTEV